MSLRPVVNSRVTIRTECVNSLLAHITLVSICPLQKVKIVGWIVIWAISLWLGANNLTYKPFNKLVKIE